MLDIVPVKRGTPVVKREPDGQEPAGGSWPQPYARDWLSAPFREFDELWDRVGQALLYLRAAGAAAAMPRPAGPPTSFAARTPRSSSCCAARWPGLAGCR